MIGRVKERFKELEEKEWEWRSFYSGWLEGRADMLAQVKGLGQYKAEQKQNEAVDLDELRDEHSALIGDDLDDLSFWSGREVMKKEDFIKAIEAFNQQKK